MTTSDGFDAYRIDSVDGSTRAGIAHVSLDEHSPRELVIRAA